MSSSKLRISVFNAAIYQAGWFACVLGASNGWAVEGALVALGLSALHLTLAEDLGAEVKLLVFAGLLGATIDSLHARFGILEFRGSTAAAIAPLWIIALWVQFGTVLHYCMHWLSRRYLLASLLGLIGGPLSFLAGERLGAASFGEPRAFAIAVLAFSWSLALPTLVWAADRLGGQGSYRAPWRSTAGVAAASN